MSSGPATVVLLCGNPLQGPRKLLDGPGRLVVETKSPDLARHALETMAVVLFVCDLATEGVDFAALADFAAKVPHVVFEPNDGVTEEELKAGVENYVKQVRA